MDLFLGLGFCIHSVELWLSKVLELEAAFTRGTRTGLDKVTEAEKDKF